MKASRISRLDRWNQNVLELHGAVQPVERLAARVRPFLGDDDVVRAVFSARRGPVNRLANWWLGAVFLVTVLAHPSVDAGESRLFGALVTGLIAGVIIAVVGGLPRIVNQLRQTWVLVAELADSVVLLRCRKLTRYRPVAVELRGLLADSIRVVDPSRPECIRIAGRDYWVPEMWRSDATQLAIRSGHSGGPRDTHD